MSEYIADILYAVGQTTLPRKTDGVDVEAMAYLSGMRKLAERLKGRELYTFDASALRAAADLRVDTPERVERLVAAVFSEPRQLFFEADVEQRDEAMETLRGFFGHLQGGRRPAQRFGVFVDILGNGKARIQPVWMHARTVAREDPRIADRFASLKEYPTSVKNAIGGALRLAPSPLCGQMDISRHVGMSKSEFEFALTQIASGYDPLLDRANEAVETSGGVRAAGQVRDRFWRMMRFRDITRVEVDADLDLGPIAEEVQSLYPRAMLDPLEEGLHVIAMMAVLEVDTGDINKTPRSRSSKKSKKDKKEKAPAQSKEMAPGLSVVTLNIGDQSLQRFYESGSPSFERSEPSESTGRARHPVRGHLFLARNGKITWRRPHWRGNIEKSTIRRVVAPAYKD